MIDFSPSKLMKDIHINLREMLTCVFGA